MQDFLTTFAAPGPGEPKPPFEIPPEIPPEMPDMPVPLEMPAESASESPFVIPERRIS